MTKAKEQRRKRIRNVKWFKYENGTYIETLHSNIHILLL